MGKTIRTGQVTAAETQFALAELVRLLAPANVLEIGTFFADTARVIATAMADVGAGHLTTIDPFGAHRVPNIIAEWPAYVRDHVTFRPDNSMSFYLYLDEEMHAKRGNEAPFDIIFVDGHHSFDYAFFDLMRSSLFLRPGGALVVDNIEQPGPSSAIRFFLERHTHWHLFRTGAAETRQQELCFHVAANSAIILAPDGIEIGALPYRVDLYELPISEVTQLEIDVRRWSPGLLNAFVNFYSRPGDCALTGKGEQVRVGVGENKLGADGGGPVIVRYQPPLALSPGPNDFVAAQVELSFMPEGRDNLLVDVDSLKLS